MHKVYYSNDFSNLNICRLNIRLTSRCNQHCKSCNTHKYIIDDEITCDEIINFVEQAKSLYDIRNIAFTGGEPTFRKDFLQIVKKCHQLSDTLSLTTNGYLFNDEQSVKNILDAGINRITFSYHGRHIHDEFTGVNGAELRIINALRYIKTIGKDVFIKIGTLYTGDNIDVISDMLDFCEENGLMLFIELLDYSMPIFRESNLSNEKPLSKISEKQITSDILLMQKWIDNKRSVVLSDSSLKFIDAYLHGKQLSGQCPSGLTDIYLDCDGNIYSGCWVLPPIGNIRENTLAQIMNGDLYKSNINNMLMGKCINCTCNYVFRSSFLFD